MTGFASAECLQRSSVAQKLIHFKHPQNQKRKKKKLVNLQRSEEKKKRRAGVTIFSSIQEEEEYFHWWSELAKHPQHPLQSFCRCHPATGFRASPSPLPRRTDQYTALCFLRSSKPNLLQANTKRRKEVRKEVS